MKKRNFTKMENICKKAWKTLSEDGMDVKPFYLSPFNHRCPACEIAKLTAETIDGLSLKDCRYCPIDHWRKQAKPSSVAICKLNKNAYRKWCLGHSTERKKEAKRISKYKWTYLPVYKKVGDSVIEDKIKEVRSAQNDKT